MCAGNRTDQCGLSRAIRTDQSNDLSFGKAKANVFQRLNAAKSLTDAFQLEDYTAHCAEAPLTRRVTRAIIF